MRREHLLKTGAALAVIATAITMVGCGNSTDSAGSGGSTASGDGSKGNLTGSLTVDGSSTVFPIAQQMGEDFGKENAEVKVSINQSGTGSGFQKFARGESDVATASRPIEDKEDSDLKSKGIDYIEIPIAYDGVSVVVSPQNNWADKLTLAELKAAWNAASTVKLWSDIRPTFPKEKINFYGPTDNHGTYEYFTTAVDGKKGDIRTDCQKSQEYPPIVQAVSGDKDGIGYMGYNYYFENKDKLKVVPIDSGKGPIAPSTQTIVDGTYTPLSRPLFLYVSKKAYESNPAVKGFIQFALGDKGTQAITEGGFVPFPKDLHDAIVKHVTDEKTGTLFKGVTPGTKLSELFAKVSGN